MNKAADIVAYNRPPPPNFVGAEPTIHVVQADNRPTDPEHLLIGYLVLMGMFTILGWAINLLTGWPLAATVILCLALFALTGFLLFLIANGDFPAIVEIWLQYRERRNVIGKHSTLETLKENHRHVERMAELGNEELQITATVEHNAALLEMERLTHRTMLPGNLEPGFVDPTPQAAAARNLARETIAGYYHRDMDGGLPRTDLVQGTESASPGKFRRAVPWSDNGAWPTGTPPEVGKSARKMLLEGDRGQPPPVLTITNGYALNLRDYPTRRAFLSMWR